MNIDLTLEIPMPPLRYANGLMSRESAEASFREWQESLQPDRLVTLPPDKSTPLVRIDAQGMSVMAVVALLRETADQLDDDQRYLELNGEVRYATTSDVRDPRDVVACDVTGPREATSRCQKPVFHEGEHQDAAGGVWP